MLFCRTHADDNNPSPPVPLSDQPTLHLSEFEEPSISPTRTMDESVLCPSHFLSPLPHVVVQPPPNLKYTYKKYCLRNASTKFFVSRRYTYPLQRGTISSSTNTRLLHLRSPFSCQSDSLFCLRRHTNCDHWSHAFPIF